MNAVITKSAVPMTLAVATLAVATLGQAGVAHAESIDRSLGSVPSITINYTALDISKPQGLQVLYARLKDAARSVCDLDNAPRNLARMRNAKACYQSTLDNAVRQVNRPTLTAMHRAKKRPALG